jgi:integrase
MTYNPMNVELQTPTDKYLHYVGRHGNSMQYFNVVLIYVNKALRNGVPLNTPEHLRPSHMTHMMSIEKADTSKNNIRRFLNGFANFCVRHDLIPKNPFALVPPAHVEPADPHVITPDQAANLLEDVVENFPECVAGVAILLFAGLRKSEIVRLTWDSVSLEAGYIMLSSSITKTRRRRVVEISANLRRILELAPRQDPEMVLNHAMLTSLRYVFRRNNIPRNALRHTFASAKLALTKDVMRVSEEMGNSPQIVYAHYSGLYTPNQATLYYGTFPSSLRAYRRPEPSPASQD